MISDPSRKNVWYASQWARVRRVCVPTDAATRESRDAPGSQTAIPADCAVVTARGPCRLDREKVVRTVALTWVVQATSLATTSRKESLAVDSDRITKKTPDPLSVGS